MNGRCTWPVRSLHTAVDGRIHRPQTRACTRYTVACTAVNTAVSIGSTRLFTGRVLYTGRKHGRVQGTRPCTRPFSGHGRTMHGRVHGTYTAVHTGRKDGGVDGRVDGRARSCIRYVHGRVRAAYRAVFCHVPAAYTAVFRTRTDHVHGPCTVVYTVCTRPRAAAHSLYTAAHGRVQTVYTAVHGPCTWPVRDHVHGRVYGRVDGRKQTAVFTARVHGGGGTVYMAVYTAVYGVYGPCTPACNGRVHSASTAVHRVDLHGRVLCTRPCFGIVRTVNRVHAASINETNFAQHKPSTIFMNRSS